ncbi:MAG: hypothetical protein ACXAE3_06545 [Candidatus Kariarchaeaceae archaeon]
MRVKALLGSLSLLLLPFAVILQSLGDISSSRTFQALFWFSTDSNLLGFENRTSSTFSSSWFSEGGLYQQYFGSLALLGYAIMAISLAAVILSLMATSKDRKNVPALLLLISSIGLLTIRFVVLGDNDLSFYYQSDILLYTYIEIPLSAILGIIFAIFDLVSK